MELNLAEKLIQIRTKEEQIFLLDFISREKDELLLSKNNDDLIRFAILEFINIYNPLSPEWKNKVIKDFSISLILFYDKGQKNISEPILKLIEDTFNETSRFKTLYLIRLSIKN